MGRSSQIVCLEIQYLTHNALDLLACCERAVSGHCSNPVEVTNGHARLHGEMLYLIHKYPPKQKLKDISKVSDTHEASGLQADALKDTPAQKPGDMISAES